MTHNEYLSEHISELRWLVYELSQEMEALVSTPYPQVHRLLMHSLSRKIVQVAESACSSLTAPVADPVAGGLARLVERQREQASLTSSPKEG